MSFRPVDEAARERARSDHAVSLVIEAGAGTGKTTLLVERILALVLTGGVRLDEIAAVTFTENAATTMKLRLRERLEQARLHLPGRERAAMALEVLERAPICTIHALCALILAERPLECGVVPGFGVADEAQSDLLFRDAWEEWLAERLTGDDEVLLEALDRGIPLEGETVYSERSSLRGLARALVEQRDLRPLREEGVLDPAPWREELLAKAARARELTQTVKEGDALLARLQSLSAFAEASRAFTGRALLRHLARLPEIPKHFGFKPRWPSAEALQEGRGIAEWTKEKGQAWAKAASADLHGRVVAALVEVAARYQKKKTERGLLDFLDLLLKARDALRGNEALRRYCRRRFRLLLIDEFQDTDPLQVEIARLLAGDTPGGLVVVGDAKQSIYRFRRAEVALFRRLSEEARALPGRAVLHLTQNFRSRPAILRFVNRVFPELMQASPEADQPAYEAIAPPPGLPDEPSVLALRFEGPFLEGNDLLRAEAACLATFIARVAEGDHEVRDTEKGTTRASRAGDVMVLARRLTQMRHLEEALEAAGLRYAVEGGKSFFDRQEVHETLAVLRAIEDPSDRLSLVAALRSSFFGASDRDIVSYRLAGGALEMGTVEEDKPGAAALGPALRLLAELHDLRTRVSVPSLLDRLYDQTRVLAALTGTRRGEAQIANLEKVASLARQASELGVLTLRGFANLVAERITSAREEPDLPTTRPGDENTVRILSIHKAKGLEAPVVALYDTADDARTRPDAVPVWEQGTIAIGFRGGCQPPGWDQLVKGEEAKAWAEARRLLYVACTRARDFLVVPQPPADARLGSFWKDLIGRLPPSSDGDVRVLEMASLPSPAREAARPEAAAAAGEDPVAVRWDAERAAQIEAASCRPFVPVSVTRAATGTAPPGVMASPGEGGREFGALVHRILEWIPLHDPDAVGMARALAPRFGLGADDADRAAAAAAKVLALPVMERARRARRLWRELPVSFPDAGRLVEGVVDLVFEEDAALVVVDYKTHHIPPEQALAQAAHHAPQLQLYGRGLAQATRLPIKERLVLFTALGRAIAV